jgi:hypothetical protein
VKDPTVTIVHVLMDLIDERKECVDRIAEIEDALRQVRAVIDHELGATSTLLSVDISADVAAALSPLPPVDDTLVRSILRREEIALGLKTCQRVGCTNTVPARASGPRGGGHPPAYCSDACRKEWHRSKRQDWRGAHQTSATCQRVGCGKSFTPTKGSAGRYCSRECFAAAATKPPTRIEDTHETVWNGGPGLSSAIGQSSLHGANDVGRTTRA